MKAVWCQNTAGGIDGIAIDDAGRLYKPTATTETSWLWTSTGRTVEVPNELASIFKKLQESLEMYASVSGYRLVEELEYGSIDPNNQFVTDAAKIVQLMSDQCVAFQKEANLYLRQMVVDKQICL